MSSAAFARSDPQASPRDRVRCELLLGRLHVMTGLFLALPPSLDFARHIFSKISINAYPVGNEGVKSGELMQKA